MMAENQTSRLGNPLKGLTVLITRAESQNKAQMAMIDELGGKAIAAPCLGIRFVADARKRKELEENLRWADGVVFTSANAVEAVARLGGLAGILSSLQLWAVGPSTRQGLADRLGGDIAIGCPERGAGAAAMLGLEGLRALQGRKMLLLRGAPSLGNILPILAERGAAVREQILYASHSVRPNLVAAFGGGAKIEAVMVGSIGALQGLAEATRDSRWSQLQESALMIAASARIAAEARRLGWRRVAPSARPDDDGMVETLLAKLAEDRSVHEG